MPIGASLTHYSPVREPTPHTPHPASSAGIPTIRHPAGRRTPQPNPPRLSTGGWILVVLTSVCTRQLIQRPDYVPTSNECVACGYRSVWQVARCAIPFASIARCIALYTDECMQRASAPETRPPPCARTRATSSLDPCRPCHAVHQSPGARYRDPRAVTSDRPRPPVPPSRPGGACRDISYGERSSPRMPARYAASGVAPACGLTLGRALLAPQQTYRPPV